MARGTLKRSRTVRPRGKPTPFEIGYVIGLIVGEGSFTHDRRPVLSVKLHERDPKPLQALTGIFGGNVYGPYHHSGRDYLLWMLRGKQLAGLLPIIDAFLPDSHKREQFIAWRLEWFGEATQLLLRDLQL